MKKKLLLFFFSFLMLNVQAQFDNLLNKAKQKTKDKVNQRIDQKMDKTIDKTLDNAESSTKKGNKNKTDNPGDDEKGTDGKPGEVPGGKEVSLKSYSKFDFVPGEKLIASEDFSQDAVGDFPAKWNTNSGGEIVTTNSAAGKYLLTQKEVVFYPEWIKSLPDNFTAEFDLLCTDKFSFYSGAFFIGFSTSQSVGKNFKSFERFGKGKLDDGGGFEVSFHPQDAAFKLGTTAFLSTSKKTDVISHDVSQDRFIVAGNRNAHISIWRQKNRVRVYINDKKVWDLPKALPEGIKLSSVYFRNDGSSNENDGYYFANFRLAVGAPDTRNKLITEGKFVTHGILFDVNSDRIKPESYGAVKDIASVLKENESVNVLIVGHTDSDGSDDANIELSKKRASAIKNCLVNEFGINQGRLSTDGKGETKPIGDNKTTLGKAENRRVEFIKQ